MAAAEWNKTEERGDAILLQMSFDDGDPDNPQQLDISTWDFRYTAKPADSETTDDSDAVITVDPLQWTKDDSGAYGGGAVDRITYLVPSAVTGLILVGDYIQDLQVTRAGEPYTYAKGQLVIVKDVTKRTS